MAASHAGTCDVTEPEAIEAARSGERTALAWLMGRYKHMVHTVAFRVLRQREDAEEVAQDAFVKAFRSLEGYQGGGKFSTWLYSIAYRTAISKLRSRRRNITTVDDLSVFDDREAVMPRSDGEAHDRRALLEFALAQLDPEDAAVVTLYYLHELNVEEIVTVTGLGASNVKVKLHRSRKRLQEILQRHMKEEVWTLQVD